MGKLAIYGGEPIRDKPLPHMHPGSAMMDEGEVNAAVEVIRSGSLFRYYGPKFLNKTKEFEKKFSEYIGSKNVLAVSSGTAALHVALKAIGVEPGDEVILPASTWVACPSAVHLSGGMPIVAEVDETLTLDPQDVREKITDKTKAIMAVHIRGGSCNMDPILKIAKKYDIMVIEDCAQAMGGSYKGKKLGSMGDIAMFSFQLNKGITAGEGGTIVTDNDEYYQRSVMFHDSGSLYFHGSGSLYREDFGVAPIVGTNYRANELQAAILSCQLGKVDQIVNRMRKNQQKIKNGISDIKDITFRKLSSSDGDTGVCLVFFVQTAELARKFSKALRSENLYVSSGGYPNPIYDPNVSDGHVYTQWKHILGEDRANESKCPKTIDLLSRAVHLDISPLLSNRDIQSIIAGIHKITDGFR